MIARQHRIEAVGTCRALVPASSDPNAVTASTGGRLSAMIAADPKADLIRHLQTGREALLWNLDGLSEHDVRRPLVPTPAVRNRTNPTCPLATTPLASALAFLRALGKGSTSSRDRRGSADAAH